MLITNDVKIIFKCPLNKLQNNIILQEVMCGLNARLNKILLIFFVFKQQSEFLNRNEFYELLLLYPIRVVCYLRQLGG